MPAALQCLVLLGDSLICGRVSSPGNHTVHSDGPLVIFTVVFEDPPHSVAVIDVDYSADFATYIFKSEFRVFLS